MLYSLLIGILFGVTAGLSPGPLLTLVIAETLEHGVGAGIKVAFSPLVTDLPIILLTLFAFTQFSDLESVLGVISLAGGCYVLYMGYEKIRSNGQYPNQVKTKPTSLTKGVLTNALSPHPYLFWLSVGAPAVMKSLNTSIAAPFLFVGGFYVFLVGAKITLAIFVAKSTNFMTESIYLYTMKFLGLALIIFSIVLFVDGIKLLGLVDA